MGKAWDRIKHGRDKDREDFDPEHLDTETAEHIAEAYQFFRFTADEREAVQLVALYFGLLYDEDDEDEDEDEDESES